LGNEKTKKEQEGQVTVFKREGRRGASNDQLYNCSKQKDANDLPIVFKEESREERFVS